MLTNLAPPLGVALMVAPGSLAKLKADRAASFSLLEDLQIRSTCGLPLHLALLLASPGTPWQPLGWLGPLVNLAIVWA